MPLLQVLFYSSTKDMNIKTRHKWHKVVHFINRLPSDKTGEQHGIVWKKKLHENLVVVNELNSIKKQWNSA